MATSSQKAAREEVIIILVRDTLPSNIKIQCIFVLKFNFFPAICYFVMKLL